MKNLIVFGALAFLVLLSVGDPNKALVVSVLGVLVWAVVNLHKRVAALESALKAQPRSKTGETDAVPQPRGADPTPLVLAPDAGPAIREAPDESPVGVRPAPAPLATTPRNLPMRSRSTQVSGQGDELVIPAWLDSLGIVIRKNLLALGGVLLVTLGLAFLFPLLDLQRLFPPALRLATACFLGSGLVVIGWRMRHSRPAYAQVLQGGGLAIDYLTLYVAFAYYQLVSGELSLIGFAGLSALTVRISLVQHAPALAAVGFAGAYAAPVLTVHGTDQLLVVLSYLLLVNLAAAACAITRRWWWLIVLSFCASVLVAGGTYLGYPEPPGLMAQQILLAAHTMLFIAAVPLYASYLEGGALPRPLYAVWAGTPMVALSLETWIAGPYAAGYAALLMAVAYLSVRLWKSKIGEEVTRFSQVMAAGSLATGVLACLDDTRLAAVILGVEAMLLHIVAAGLGLRITAWALFAVALAVLNAPGPAPSPGGAVLLCLALSIASSWAERRRVWVEASVMAVGGFFALLPSFDRWLEGLYVSQQQVLVCSLLLTVVVLALAVWAHRRFTWQAGLLWLVPTGLYWLASLVNQVEQAPGFEILRLVLVLGLLVVAALFLHRRQLETRPQRYPAMRLAWIIVSIATASILAHQHLSGWPGDAEFWSLTVHGAALAACGLWPGARVWVGDAIAGAFAMFVNLWRILVAITLVLVFLSYPTSFTSTGLFEPVLLAWYMTIGVLAFCGDRESRFLRLPLALWLGLTYAVVRVVGHLEGFGGEPAQLLVSNGTVQPSISLGWAILGVALLAWAVRAGHRVVWMAGAALCVATALKLLLFDLAAVDAIYRVISFIGVGFIFLLAGYLAPLPPADTRPQPKPNTGQS
ncbi:MAG: hypothetical protein RIR70_1919 [Pseudomonadota bacterium]|jgi:uncharacterized membrane protein